MKDINLKELKNWELESLNGPIMLSWDVTNRCNFNCQHCLNRSNDCKAHDFSDELTDKECDMLVQQIIDVRPYSMCICGGEPTLRSNLFDIISKISKSGCKVNMVSNGYLIDEDYAQKLVEAGLFFLQISLDSIHPELHDKFRGRDGAFDAAVRALKILSKTNVVIATAMTPTKFNIHEFPEYVDFIRSLGCNYVRMMPILPMGRGYEHFKDLEPTAEQYLKFVVDIEKIKVKYPDFRVEWGDPLEHIYLAEYTKRTQPIVMEIRSNGDIGVSIYLPISVGYIRRHSIK